MNLESIKIRKPLETLWVFLIIYIKYKRDGTDSDNGFRNT